MFRFSNISIKIGAGLLALILLIAIVTGIIVKGGFDQAERSAVQLSADSLQTQSKLTLMQLTELQAQAYARELQRASRMTVIAADYMKTAQESGKNINWSNTQNVVYQFSQLTRSPDGLLYYDANPKRTTEILHIGSIQHDETTDQRLQQSAMLDGLFPSLLAQVDSGVAIYFQSSQLTLRYYPVRGLPELVKETGVLLDAQSAGLQDIPAGPIHNPQKSTIWLPPYIDNAGQGVLVTSETPIYLDDEFQGYIGIDVSLSGLIADLDALKPTNSSFVFLLDQNGKLVAIDPGNAQRLADHRLSAEDVSISGLLGTTLNDLNPQLSEAMTSMLDAKKGTLDIDLAGQPAFIAFSRLEDLNWMLAVVVPLNEVTAKSEVVSSALKKDGTTTVRNTLLVMGIFLIAAGLLGFFLSRRFLTKPLLEMLSGVRSITAGNLDVSVPVTSQDELGELAGSFNQMASKLSRSTQALSQTSAELQVKEAQLKVATLEERQRLARELHDSVSQSLYGISLGAHTALKQMQDNPEKLKEPLNYILSLAEGGISEMRALIFELRPESLENEGLVAAIIKQADALQARYKITVRTDLCEEPDCPLDVKEALYRITQEGMQNVIKHARAACVEIHLTEDNSHLILEIKDNGKGFDPTRSFPGHLGLRSMSERVDKIDGEINVQSEPGVGTSIKVVAPI